MIEDTPQNQIKHLEQQVMELSRKVEEFTNPTTIPDQFLKTLVTKGFVKYDFEINTFTNASGLDFPSFMADFQDKRGLISFTPSTSLIVYTASTSDTLTATNHGLSDTQQVYALTTGQHPSPLNPQQVYYVRDATRDTFKLALTSGGAAIDITSVGSGDNYILLT